jgi:hypothetical protein
MFRDFGDGKSMLTSKLPSTAPAREHLQIAEATEKL